MYSLNINFLKDRPEFQAGAKPAAKKRESSGIDLSGQTPLYVGVVAAVVALLGVGGAFLALSSEIGKLQNQQLTLDNDLSDLQAQMAKADRAEAEIKVIRDQTRALAEVFGKIRAWSAIFGDIRDRLIPGVQVMKMQEEAPKAARSSARPDPNAAAAPPPKKTIRISGNASSVDAVGDFLLQLRESPFLDADATKLVKTEYQDNTANVEIPDGGETVDFDTLPEGLSYTLVNPGELEGVAAELGNLPQVVEFEIETAYTTSTADELIAELDEQGAVGLLARLNTIKDIMNQADIKPAPAASPSPEPDPSASP